MIDVFKTNPFAISWKKKLEKAHPELATRNGKKIAVKCLCGECDLDDYTLKFWSEKISIRNDSNVARIDGNHYIIGSGHNKTKGMGGSKFKIEFFDGRIVESDDLWHQGRIPESYRQVLEDNAKFI